MAQTALVGISIFIAVVSGFSILIALSPDPTGILPLVGTVILSAVLGPVLYYGIQQMTAQLH
ncbi:uncharacterized protein Hqrw_5084 (plasmid) [Haloquadratum walsbyi C23]|uniref:Uncharacterized protein n=2 Tax=Haloquadratum walsbyi TaxID=293091 RepID=G0LNE9_HALWC|nr:uncharacterized protein Hqrw_5084 [Haloquadratum walsbyi C23]